MDLVDGLKAFVATAQTGSFTEAGERLGISNRLTSKYVAELEKRVGARLFQRTTRKVGLTSSGQALLARAPALLEELDDMMEMVSEPAKGLSGNLRIAAPLTFGEMYIKDLLARFMEHHPTLTVDLRLSDEYVDFASDGFDLAFRIATPNIASLKVRKLGKMGGKVVASPAYLEKYGTPKTPEELTNHRCIIDTNRRDPTRWVLSKNGVEKSVVIQRQLLVNSAKVASDWAASGQGISMCPDFVLEQHLESGRLTTVLDDYDAPVHPICAVYLAGTVMPKKVRALIDFAIEDIKQSPFG